jgi:hypothetical protein
LGYFFWFGRREEEDVEEIHMSQNVVTTRSGSNTSSSDSPSTYDPTKTTSNTHKTSSGDKPTAYSTPPSKLIMISWKT